MNCDQVPEYADKVSHGPTIFFRFQRVVWCNGICNFSFSYYYYWHFGISFHVKGCIISQNKIITPEQGLNRSALTS